MLIDLKLVLSTFLKIFLPELGDKTQISIFATNRSSLRVYFIDTGVEIGCSLYCGS